MFGLKKSQDNWKGIQANFIISTGRTGTKFLSTFFGKFDHIDSRHEPEPNFLILGNHYATGKISHEKAKKKILKGRVHVLKSMQKNGKKIYIESNNMLYSLIPVLDSVFDKPKIVHIVRDGRDVVRSGMCRPWYTENDHFHRIAAPNFVDDPFSAEWHKMDKFEKICWWWQKRDRIIYESVQKHCESITIKFENIFYETNGISGLKEIIDFLNIDIPYNSSILNCKTNETPHLSFPHWKDWNADLKAKFERIAGKHAKRYGYVNSKMYSVRKKIDDKANSVYKSINYDTKGRFCSYWHQIDEVCSLLPNNVLEIGVGNGFVRSYLREKKLIFILWILT